MIEVTEENALYTIVTWHLFLGHKTVGKQKLQMWHEMDFQQLAELR